MATEVTKKVRPIPKSVLLAKERGDTEELRRLGSLGNKMKRELQHWRECQGVLPLKMQRQPQSVHSRKPLTPEHRAKIAESQLINRARREELAAITLADAEAHAEANRVGWCDED